MNYSDLDIITLNQENIDDEHICCAMNDKKNESGMLKKKTWLKAQFDQGYTFKKLDARGKVFIEYMPAEIAWRPVIAPGYTFIQCLWVSGKFKGNGQGKRLLQACEEDSRDSNGLVVVTSAKPFLTDKKFFLHHGFQIIDKAPPHFELLVKKFGNAPDPVFSAFAKNPFSSFEDGIHIVYTAQCPFTEYYIRLLREVSEREQIPFIADKFDKPMQCQEATSAYGTFNLYYKGEFKTHVIPTEKQLLKLISKS